MKKLSLDALKERAEAVASEEVLASISGGLENACHDKLPPATGLPPVITIDPPQMLGNDSGWVRIRF